MSHFTFQMWGRITFSEGQKPYKYLHEYKEQKLNGRIVCLKAYDDKTCNVHEHIIRNIPSFSEFIDRELQNRIALAEGSPMKITDFISKFNEPVIIQFKSFNFAIIKVRIV